MRHPSGHQALPWVFLMLLMSLVAVPARPSEAESNAAIGLRAGGSSVANVPAFEVTSVPQDVGDDAGPQSVLLADVNNDGRADLLAINRLAGSTKVLIRIAAEDGTFQDPPTEVDLFIDEDFAIPTALAVGDVGSPFVGPEEGSADGNPDIVVNTEDGYVVILTGDGEGGFAVREEILDTLVEGRGVTLADIDDDEDIDIVAVDEDTLYIIPNEGFAFNIDESLEYDLDNEVDAIDVATGDFDGDGDIDVIALNLDERTISLFLGDGTGAFTDEGFKISTSASPDDEEQIPRDFAVAKLDGDAIDDVVVLNFGEFDNLQALVLSGAGLGNRTGLSGPFGGTGVALANFDDDAGGTIDAILLSESEGASFLVGDGSPSGFPDVPGIVISGVGNGRAIAAGDIDGDGKPDFVVLNNDGNEFDVAINQGIPTPTPTPTSTVTPTATNSDPTPTVTPTRTVATPTFTPTPTEISTSTVPPTSTSTPSAPTATPPLNLQDDDGCAIATTEARSIPSPVWMLPVAVLLWRRRRSGSEIRRSF